MSRRPARHRWLAAAAFGLVAILLLPALVVAHPLGNFTINHYAGLRIEADRILLDIVIDQAEIPTFQARLLLDTDGDGELSDPETDAGRVAACADLAGSLELRVDDIAQTLSMTEAGLTFPPGAGGLSTMRSVCGFAALMAAPLDAAVRVTFVDRSFNERLGWREIVVAGSGVFVAAAEGELRSSSPSNRLTAYPTDLLAQVLADSQVTVVATPGGPALAPLDIADALALPGADDLVAASAAPNAAGGSSVSEAPGPRATNGSAAVPGGVSVGELPAIFRTADLTPVVLLISVLTAAALGAGHALTPGHGKTLMAAYLVGTRGTPVHAAGLGLSVALSHTLGILALAGLVVGAQGILPPDVVVRTAPVVAAISIVAIGGWMLLGEGRRRRGARAAAAAHDRAHATGAGHKHDESRHDHHDDPAVGEHAHRGIRHNGSSTALAAPQPATPRA